LSQYQHNFPHPCARRGKNYTINDNIANLNVLVEEKAMMKRLAFMIMYNISLTSSFWVLHKFNVKNMKIYFHGNRMISGLILQPIRG
jgi:hypothetical protein